MEINHPVGIFIEHIDFVIDMKREFLYRDRSHIEITTNKYVGLLLAILKYFYSENSSQCPVLNIIIGI